MDAHSLRITVQEKIRDHTGKKESFAFESNLVSNYSYEIVTELSTKGYSTYLVYIGANELSTLNFRIDQRVQEGLHYVSPEDVRQRYEEALRKLPSNLKHFDKVVFLDNSLQGEVPAEILHVEKGVIKWKSQQTPIWLNQILPTIQKLSAVYAKLQQE
jgi:predicted ABC-type ATPase